MWFKTAPGVTDISVEQMSFHCTIFDDEEAEPSYRRGYFTAPDHFAAKILELPGFSVSDPPEGAPEDTANKDILRDGALSDLMKKIAQLQQENGELTTEHRGAIQQVNRLYQECEALKVEKETLVGQIRELEEELESYRAPEEAKKAVGKK